MDCLSSANGKNSELVDLLTEDCSQRPLNLEHCPIGLEKGLGLLRFARCVSIVYIHGFAGILYLFWVSTVLPFSPQAACQGIAGVASTSPCLDRTCRT